MKKALRIDIDLCWKDVVEFVQGARGTIIVAIDLIIGSHGGPVGNVRTVVRDIADPIAIAVARGAAVRADVTSVQAFNTDACAGIRALRVSRRSLIELHVEDAMALYQLRVSGIGVVDAAGENVCTAEVARYELNAAQFVRA